MVSRFPRVRSYELMVIFHPETEDEALAEQIGRVQSYVTDVDGTVTVLNRDNPWGRRRLAYPIRHESRDLRDGIYVLVYFDVEAGRTVDIEREIKLNTRIIRYMLIQQSTPTMEPPAPPAETPPPADGQPAPAGGSTVPPPTASLEVSPGTPPEAVPTPLEPTVPSASGQPLAAEENLTAPVLDSSPEPSLPSETLPPADASLVETVTGAESPDTPTSVSADVPTEDAPPEAVDLGVTVEDTPAASSGSTDDDPTPPASA